MMKISLIAAFPLLLGGITLPTMNISFELGPYSKYQNNPSIKYSIKSTYTSEKTIYEIIRFGTPSNPNQQTVTKANHSIGYNAKYEGYVTVPTKTFLGDSGMRMALEVYDTNGTQLKTSVVTIYPRNSVTINPTTYSSATYSCPVTHVKVSNSLTFYTNEEYRFTNVEDYFNTDIYYRLPLEQFEIQTSLDSSIFTYESAYLIIQGMEDCFPHLTYTNGQVKIPLEVIYNTNRLRVNLLNNIYVHSKLLFISLTPLNNYVATKNFYLPINHLNDLMGASFTIEINKVGLNQSTFRWTASLISGSPLVGNCQSSGYCVVGRVSK